MDSKYSVIENGNKSNAMTNGFAIKRKFSNGTNQQYYNNNNNNNAKKPNLSNDNNKNSIPKLSIDEQRRRLPIYNLKPK